MPESGSFSHWGLTAEQMQGFLKSQSEATLLECAGSPGEIAKFSLFLSSDDGSYVNGVVLFVDGGIAQI
jgi:NAD(P)-dependent dehydrogenase (short-subunit alcohol dehydrogenase family)